MDTSGLPGGARLGLLRADALRGAAGLRAAGALRAARRGGGGASQSIGTARRRGGGRRGASSSEDDSSMGAGADRRFGARRRGAGASSSDDDSSMGAGALRRFEDAGAPERRRFAELLERVRRWPRRRS